MMSKEYAPNVGRDPFIRILLAGLSIWIAFVRSRQAAAAYIVSSAKVWNLTFILRSDHRPTRIQLHIGDIVAYRTH